MVCVKRKIVGRCWRNKKREKVCGTRRGRGERQTVTVVTEAGI